jgi:hypothetical protein
MRMRILSLEVRDLNKKWRKIIITSMIILFLEVAGSLIFLFPYYRMQRVFNSIDKGQWTKTQEYYDGLNDSQKEKADSYMDAYGAYITERYVDGDITYLQAAASFDAINSISDNTEVFDKYTPDIDRNEYVKLVNQLFNANINKNTEKKYETISALSDIQKRMSADTREGILVELLNRKMEEYMSGSLSYDDMHTFAHLVTGMSINTAYDYAYTVEAYVQNMEDFRAKYSDVESLISDEDYLGAITLIDEQQLYDFDKEYYELYQTTRQTAYDEGLSYYPVLLQSYIDAGDTEKAMTLVAALEPVYGSDMDLDFVKDALMTDWQRACISRLGDWESYLKTELGNDDTGKYILENVYDELKPDSLVLHDINEDGYPELLMFNSGKLDGDYVGTFIFGYDGSEYKYMGYVNIISFGISSNLVAFPICFGRDAGEEVCLYNYNGETLSAGSSAQKIGSAYYVDGAESSDIDYLSAQTAIMLNQDVTRIQNSGYVSIDDYREYVITYENEYEVSDEDTENQNEEGTDTETIDDSGEETTEEAAE